VLLSGCKEQKRRRGARRAAAATWRARRGEARPSCGPADASLCTSGLLVFAPNRRTRNPVSRNRLRFRDPEPGANSLPLLPYASTHGRSSEVATSPSSMSDRAGGGNAGPKAPPGLSAAAAKPVNGAAAAGVPPPQRGVSPADGRAGCARRSHAARCGVRARRSRLRATQRAPMRSGRFFLALTRLPPRAARPGPRRLALAALIRLPVRGGPDRRLVGSSCGGC
jgi:hypothetical protein